MQAASLPALTLVFFGALWLIGAAGGLYFWFGFNAVDKRQLYPWFSGSTLVLTLGLAYFVVQVPLPFMLFLAVIAVAGTVFHVRTTTFCPRCARMIYRGMLVGRVEYCPRCGLELDRPPQSERWPVATSTGTA